MSLDTIIELNNAAVFQGEMLVLSEVNISIEKGEFIYLIGKTGSGKSSLMQTIYADLPLKQGSAIVAEFNLENIKNQRNSFSPSKTRNCVPGFSIVNRPYCG